MSYRKIPYYLVPLGCLTLLCSILWLLFCSSMDVSAGKTEHQHIFGATYMTMSNPYYQILDEHLRARLAVNGDILLSRDAAMDQNRQNEEIADLIDAGAEVIFLTPVEWDSVEEGLEAAECANVPIIVVDAPVENDERVACSILSDNYTAGYLCGEHLLQSRDSANILLLEHVTARSGTERIKGFLDAIEGHSGYTVLASGQSDGQIENAMPVMEQLLKQYPQADTLMALNDPSAFGGMAAIEGAGLTDRFLVYSVDGTPEGKAMVKEGLITATAAQFPLKIAEKAVEQGYVALDGGDTEKEIIIPVDLLTAENVEAFGIDGWQ